MRGSSSGLQFCSVVWDEMSGNRSADAVCFNHCKRCWTEGECYSVSVRSDDEPDFSDWSKYLSSETVQYRFVQRLLLILRFILLSLFLFSYFTLLLFFVLFPFVLQSI